MLKETEAKKPDLAESINDVRDKMAMYGGQIKEYLNKIDAKVEGYKVAVEKEGDGVKIDIAFSATMHLKENA